MNQKYSQKVSYQRLSPKWSYFVFFITLFLVVLWFIPNAYKVFKSDFILMGAKYQINQWAGNEDPIDVTAWNQTLDQLKAANAIAPDNPEVLLYLGNLYALKGFRYEYRSALMKSFLYESSEYYFSALNLKPVDPLLWVNYAKVLYVVAPESDDFKDALYNAKLLGKNELYLKKIIDQLK